MPQVVITRDADGAPPPPLGAALPEAEASRARRRAAGRGDAEGGGGGGGAAAELEFDAIYTFAFNTPMLDLPRWRVVAASSSSRAALPQLSPSLLLAHPRAGASSTCLSCPRSTSRPSGARPTCA